MPMNDIQMKKTRNGEDWKPEAKKALDWGQQVCKFHVLVNVPFLGSAASTATSSEIPTGAQKSSNA